MQSELRLFVLHDVYRGKDWGGNSVEASDFCIVRTKSEAYKRFFEVLDYWDSYNSKGFRDGDERPYSDLSEEEKCEAHKRLFEGLFRYHVFVFPLSDINGMTEVIEPLEERIATLENRIRLDALKRATPLPPEIIDCVVGKYL